MPNAGQKKVLFEAEMDADPIKDGEDVTKYKARIAKKLESEFSKKG